jgi:tetratricopeptide (TPR) repeat protein
MRAILAIILLIFGLTVFPLVFARHSWAHFRADTYATQGQQLLQQHQWQKAAVAFAAAHARNPTNASFLSLKKIALALANPARKRAPQQNQSMSNTNTVQPIMAKLPIGSAAKPVYYLMAITPAAGTAEVLTPDAKGRYWGPIVRILPIPSEQPAVIAAAFKTSQTPAKASDAELAYAALSDKDFSKARALFAQAIAEDPRQQWVADNRPLAKWLAVQTGVTYRSGAPALATSQALLGQGGSWLDASARLNGNPDKPLTLAGFIYSTQSLRSQSLDPSSLQAGFGLRWQPTKTITVEAARLVKVGSQSRNDWMLRVGAGYGQWRPADLNQNSWLHWQARADAALIGLKSADVFAQADARIGLGVRLNDQLSITPYIGGTATLQKDLATATLIEMSPGLWLHRAGNIPIDARLEYRRKMAGSAAAGNGVALTFAVGF